MKRNNEVAILAGGFDGGSILNSVEVYSPDGSCNAKLPSLPLPIYGVGLFFMNESLHACGGDVNVCFELVNLPKPHWKHKTNLMLMEPRLMGATTVSNDGIVYFR